MENLEFSFQDIMDFVASENAGEKRRGSGMFQFDEEKLPAKIKVIGVGGGGAAFRGQTGPPGDRCDPAPP